MTTKADSSKSAAPGFRSPCGACADCDVRTMAVCSALADDEVGALERIMTATKLGTNEMLVQEGDPRRKVFTLTGGMLRLSVDLPDGRRQITGFLLPGDYLGLADDETYSATVEAVEPSTLCAFPVQQMEALMERYPKLKDKLFRLTRTALRHARENQMILGRLAPVEKLASFILMLSQRCADHRLSDNPVRLAMGRGDIADYLGLTVETVSRSFTKLRNQRLIDLPDAHTVKILDRRALEAVAGALG